MAKQNVPRKLVVGTRTLRYRVGHEHQVDHLDGIPQYSGCTELLSIWLDRRPNHALELAFVASQGHLVYDGLPWTHSGMVKRIAGEETYLNLHEPGVVRAFVDEALAIGWAPEGAKRRIDGWSLFERVALRRREAVAQPAS